MDKSILSGGPRMRLVGSATTIEEANRIAKRYEAEGYETEIVKKKQAGLELYEVWAGKKPDVFLSQ